MLEKTQLMITSSIDWKQWPMPNFNHSETVWSWAWSGSWSGAWSGAWQHFLHGWKWMQTRSEETCSNKWTIRMRRMRRMRWSKRNFFQISAIPKESAWPKCTIIRGKWELKMNLSLKKQKSAQFHQKIHQKARALISQLAMFIYSSKDKSNASTMTNHKITKKTSSMTKKKNNSKKSCICKNSERSKIKLGNWKKKKESMIQPMAMAMEALIARVNSIIQQTRFHSWWMRKSILTIPWRTKQDDFWLLFIN